MLYTVMYLRCTIHCQCTITIVYSILLYQYTTLTVIENFIYYK